MDSVFVIIVAEKTGWPPGSIPLGKAKGLAWASVPPEAAAALAASPVAQARLVWPNPDAYRASVAGLAKAALAEAVAKRAGAADQLLPDLADDLAYEAGRLAPTVRGLADSLFAIFMSGHRLGRITGTPNEELMLALEDRAALDACEQSIASLSQARIEPAAPLSARTQAALTRAAIALGDSALEKAPYAPRLLQGYYLRGNNSLLQEAFDRREIESVKLPGGRLALLAREQLESIRIEKPVLVFVTAEDFFRSSRWDTPPQRQARVAAVLKQGGPGLSAFLDAESRRRLDLLARMEGVLASATGLTGAARDSLRAACEAERERLGTDQSDARSQGTGSTSRLVGLARRLEALAAFAARAGAGEIATWAKHGSERLRKDAAGLLMKGAAGP